MLDMVLGKFKLPCAGPRYAVLVPVFAALNCALPPLDITMAHILPSAGTATALFKVTFICPVVHEIELVAESKLPLLSYSAPLRVSPPQLAPTSIVIDTNVVPAPRPVNKLP